MKLIFIFLIAFLGLSAENCYFLSTPHSGTHLMCCYIQALTQIPIYRLDAAPFPNPLNFTLNYSKTPLYRSHWGSEILAAHKKGDKLLFILRNPKENIRRNTIWRASSFADFQQFFFDQHPSFRLYRQNLLVFENWEIEHKLLIRYEDLISQPVIEMEKVVQFLDTSNTAFIQEDFLKKISVDTLAFYQIRYENSGGSHSKGENAEYHSGQIPVEILQSIDLFLENTYPELWEKYLKQYSTNRENSHTADQ